jgi:hypothetical protein
MFAEKIKECSQIQEKKHYITTYKKTNIDLK